METIYVYENKEVRFEFNVLEIKPGYIPNKIKIRVTFLYSI